MPLRHALIGTASARIALAFSFALSLVLACLPLVGVLGPESAFLMSLLLSPFAASAGASFAAHARASDEAPRIAFRNAFAHAATMATIATATLALNALRMRTCEPFSGVVFFVLGPFASYAASTALGVAWGTIVARRGLAIALASITPFVEIAIATHRIYATPAIFAYGHFFGFFPGTLYDEGTELTSTFVAFRMLTLVGVGGVMAIVSAAHAVRHKQMQRKGFVANACVGITLLAAFVLAHQDSDALGFTSSPASIEHLLGGKIVGARCTAIVPRELDHAESIRLAEDCDFRVAEHEAQLGVHQSQRITAYFFRNPSEKKMLMGAAHVYIAKPWRNEVYVQAEGWPHPVLSHEIAHVVAGNAARGPFKISGKWGGFWPNPGAIEGLAVALAWEEPDDLTPHEWAAALLAIGKAPSLRDTLGTSFLLSAAGRSYTIAGSFYRFLLDRYGAAIVREAYRSGDVEAATHKSIDTLDAEWRDMLRASPPSPAVLALTNERFARGAIFERACPHLVARLHGDLGAAIGAGDFAHAISTCKQILKIDPADLATRQALATSELHAGNLEAAHAMLSDLENIFRAPQSVIASARESFADALWADGNAAEALKEYDAVATFARTRDAQRVLDVKRFALREGGETSRIMARLLAGNHGHALDRVLSMYEIETLREHRHDGFADYLEARQLASIREYRAAQELAQRALSAGVALTAVEREALAMLTQYAVANGDLDAASAAASMLQLRSDITESERLESKNWSARITWMRSLKH